LFTESAGRVRWRSARTNPAVLRAWHLTTGLYGESTNMAMGVGSASAC